MVAKKIQHFNYRDDDVTNYVNFFENLCEKWLNMFFLVNLVTARKQIFKIFFQLFKVKITYTQHTHRLIG